MSFKMVRFPACPDDPGFLEVAHQDAWLLRVTPLYLHRVDGQFAVYKPGYATLTSLGIKDADLPRRLYMRVQDRELAVRDIQTTMLDGELRRMVGQGDQAQVKVALVSLFEEALVEPRIEILAKFKPMAEVLVDTYGDDPRLLKSFALLAGEGYGLAEHGVNVMTLVIALGLRLGLERETLLDLALAGLLHDVGQTRLPEALRNPLHALSDQDFARFKSHPLEGLRLLKGDIFSPLVLEAASQHHERLDGRGYPKGITKVSRAGQIVGLADCYENLTSQSLGRRLRKDPMETLALLKEETEDGKFDPQLFKAFARSLAG